jgi:hypothetical protein
MAPTTPTGEPTLLTAGDTWRWRIPDHPDYPQSEGWTLKYRLSGVTVLGFTATWQSSGDDANHWLVSVGATSTDTEVTSGRYRLFGYMEGSGTYAGRFHEVSDTVVVVGDDPRQSTAGSLQTHAERTLAVIEAALEGRLDSDIESYQIAGRAVNKIPIADLMKLRGRYAALVQRERSATTGRRHLVSFPVVS